MYHTISPPSSLALSPFPRLSKPHDFRSRQTRISNSRRRIAVVSSHKPYISLPTPPNPTSTQFRILLPNIDKNTFTFFRKSLAVALFCVTVGFFPIHHHPAHAVEAAPSVASVLPDDAVRRRKPAGSTDHEFSGHTRRLLATVSELLQAMEDVKSSKAEIRHVKESLKRVVSKRQELQDEILAALNEELRELRREKEELTKRADKIVGSFSRAKREREKLEQEEGDGDEVKGRIEKLEESMNAAEREYNEIWEKVGEIEDVILRKETMTYSVGIRELSFIQQECEVLVECFERRWKQMRAERYSTRLYDGAIYFQEALSIT